jgi:hypothetical protein
MPSENNPEPPGELEPIVNSRHKFTEWPQLLQRFAAHVDE